MNLQYLEIHGKKISILDRLERLEKCETLSSLILDYLVCILKCFLPSVNIGRYITILVTAVTKIVRLLIKFLRFSQSAVTNMVRLLKL